MGMTASIDGHQENKRVVPRPPLKNLPALPDGPGAGDFFERNADDRLRRDRRVLPPSKASYRFTLLLFISLLTFGSYFAYDSIGAIENILIQALHLQPGMIGSLYSAYSLAAIAIVFFGGVLTDKLGTRRASLLFSLLVVLGALIVALSKSGTMLFAGRLVFERGPSRWSSARWPSCPSGSRARSWPWPSAFP